MYCKTCFPDGLPDHALCNPSTGRSCYAKHCAGEQAAHKINIGIKKAVRSSPRRSGTPVDAVRPGGEPAAKRRLPAGPRS